MKHFKKFLCVVLTLLLIVPGGLAEDMALALNTEEMGASFEGDVSSVSANNDDGAAADEDAAFCISSVDSDVAEAGEMDLPADDGDVGALSVQADYTDAPSASTVTYCFIALDTLVASRTAAEGEEIAAPDAPAAPEGMVFAGWALEDGTAVFADDTPVIARTDPNISEINVIAKFAEAEIPAAPAVFAPSDEDTGSEDGAGAAGDASVSDNTEPVEEPGEGSAPAAADETAPVAADETEPGADDDPEADADAGTDGNGEEGGDADQEDADAANDADAEKEDESAKDGEAVNNADAEKDAEKDAEEEGNENAGALEDDPAEGEPNGDDASGDDDEASNEDGGEASDEHGDEASDEASDEDRDEASGEDGDEASGDAEAALQPIRVVFNITPADAVVTVKALDSEAGEAAEEQPDAQPADETPDRTSDNTDASITAQDDGSFALLPGAYTYTASAEGYKTAQDVPFTVAGDALTIDIALEAEAEVSDEESADEAVAEEAQEAQEADGAEEYPPFDQSATCNGVVVAVKADAGTFPAGAALHVSRVLLYEQRQADAAVDEVRDENMTVASSYTFDIKVLDDAGNELQPADGHAVSVSFSVDTVADENLTTTVYHIEEDGGSYTAALLETVEDGDTASAETDGFSVYTVEFAYENKTYSMAGGGSVSLSRILEGLGFVGEVTNVEVSNEELFEAVSGGQGGWIIKSKQPLSSEESMKVVIGGQEFTIAVTDYWEPVSYIDENGQVKQISEYSLVQSSDEPITWTGWYVLDDNITIPERITVSGEAHLILCPHKELKAEKGITVAAGNTLNIYAQSTNEGQDYKGVLYSGTSDTPAYCAGIGGEKDGACGTVNIIGGEIHAASGLKGAGIGGGWNGAGGTVNIIGGEIYATGGQLSAGIGGGEGGAGGNITISGGTVEATGGRDGAAGIGGGDGGAGGKVTISGGTVTANGTDGGAGIGGGNRGVGGTVAISGGTVTANGGQYGAGIGGGWNGDGGTVTIGGGKVEATGGRDGGAGIGGGAFGAGGNITISGGTVNANGGDQGAGIGGGWNGDGGTVTISGGAVTLQTNSTAQPIGHGRGDDSLSPGSLYLSRMHAFMLGASDPVKGPAVLNACRNNDNKYVRLERCTKDTPCDYCNYGEGQYAYKDAQGNVFNLLADTKVTSIYSATNYWNSGWYAVENDVTINDRVTVTGTVNLILCDGTDGQSLNTLTAEKGITVAVGNTLNIYVGKKGAANSASDIQGNGALIAGTQENTPELRAGIGGDHGAGGTVNIYGGDVIARGGDYGAGISGAGGTVNIYGGEVLAIGGENGAGIGGGQGGDGGTVNIYGGKVTAQGGVKGAGIGGGAFGAGGNITISGGTVIATGGTGGAGIGGGAGGAGGTVTLNGGTVDATGIDGGAGIGGGSMDGIISIVTIGDKITISGGKVEAKGGYNGAGIGVGSMVTAAPYVSFDGAIEISGGTVTALGGENGAGIGIGSRQGAQGEFNFKGKINIYGGTVDATGGENGAGIGGGNGGDGGNITISGKANVTTQGAGGGAGIGGGYLGAGGTIKISGSTVTANGGSGGAGIGGAGIGGGSMEGIINSVTIGDKITISGGTVTANGGSGGAGIGVGSMVAASRDVSFDGAIEISGGTVTALGGENGAGIGIGSRQGARGEFDFKGKINIYGGTVNATSGEKGAGIGGGYNGDGGTIEISGGDVNAISSGYGAGIGGGNGGAGGTIKISGTASVTATGSDDGAGIGGGKGKPGGDITISGGNITASGNPNSYGAGIGGGQDGAGGTITISGGTVNATGGENGGAGIGGGNGGAGCGDDERITISGGKMVTAKGAGGGAGIGGGKGKPGGVITINGGTVNANGGTAVGSKSGGAGIGGGKDGSEGGTIEINGGIITASGGTSYGAGIGGGDGGAGGTITVNGGTVNAYGGTYGGAGIGGGFKGPGGKIYINDGEVTANGHEGGAGIGGGSKGAGGTVTISGGEKVTATGGAGGAGIGGGNGKPGGDVTISGSEEVTATGGSDGAGIGGGEDGDGGNITISGGKKVTATGGDDGAGIGGGKFGAGGTITISSGTVTATGGKQGAGIGGGYQRAGGTITISDGEVTANGGKQGAGIGGGYLGAGGTIEISGGTVTATGNEGGAGIGSGNGGKNGNITINGGEVTATGGECGAGIGGGRYGQVDSITIEGGTVNATGGKNGGAGIGGGIAGKGDGYRVHGGTIKISDGTVNATGGEKGAGIGGGWEGAGGNITIEGGTVTAIGGTMGAGIGSGYLCQFGPSSVTISGGTVTATSNDGGAGIGAGMDSLKAGIALSYSATGGVPELPKITSSSYVGDVTMSGDFCEWLDAGHYGVVFDAENANVDLYKEAMAGLTIVPCPAGAHRIDVQLLPGYGGGAPRNRAFAAMKMKTKTGKEIPVSKAFGGSSIALRVEAAPGCEIEYRPSRLTGSDGREIHLDRNDAFTMPDCDVSAYLTRWAWLQWAIDRAANAEGSPSITLTADVRAEKWEKALAVPKGRPVTIDLAGCSIDRNLNNAAENGGVIDVTGALTVKDGSQSRTGKITGGYTVGNGGGAYVHGGGALTLTGGAVTGNRAAQGGGVYVADGSFSVSGAPKVTGNTCNGAANNVYLPRGAVIDVAGGLESGATIGVTTASNPETDGAVTLTRGLNGRGAPTAFASDEGYNVAWSSDGQEAVLPVQETILPAKLKAYGKTSLRLSWNAVDGAEGYDVFFALCGSNTYRLAGTVTDRLSYRFRKLNRHTCYKAYVRAWRTVDGVKTYTGVESLRLHAVTGGYAYKITNPKKVTVKRKAVKLAPGGKVRMGAKVTGVRSGKKVLSHVNRLRYYSTNPTVATVDEKGRITAVSLGECTVYAVANNGIRKGTRVTVKEKTVKKGKK